MVELAAPPRRLDHERLNSFLGDQYDGAHHIRLDLRSLRGGLRAGLVVNVRAYLLDAQNRSRTASFVVKCLEDGDQREAAIYQAIVAPIAAVSAPRLLAVERVEPTRCYLYLEYIRPQRRWPWVDPVRAGLVLDELATLHASAPLAAFAGSVTDWDYEAQLQRSAQATLALFESTARQEDFRSLRWALFGLRRIVAALPTVRQELRTAEAPGVIIHGDVHPGNALIRVQGAAERAVLLDWARARAGSSLEDVSSWLQSLGCWEPEARRRHDSLLRRYLAARGVSTYLGRDLRDAYWLAGACNALAGALRYHLAILTGWGNPAPRARAAAARAVDNCLRVIRRADACRR